MRIDVWSDIVCPFCYIGKRHLEGALAEFGREDEVDVVWHSFQLDPSAPRVSEVSDAELVSRKMGATVAQVEAMQRRLEQQAAAVGLEYHLGHTRSGNTLDAHRLVHLAGQHGRADQAHERFMRAYFTEGEAIGDPETLRRLAVEIGLPETRVREVLDGTEFTDAVLADQERARGLGASGVPFFVFAGAVGVSGAQPHDVFLEALERGWEAALTSQT
jgi:predicted DsbA family dithiol-disulfide isomerase